MKFEAYLKSNKIDDAIAEFCSTQKSRQREDLYNFLNQKLELSLSIYDYKGTNDHARFACDEKSQKHEADYVRLILKKLS
jgi:hypothetical protein